MDPIIRPATPGDMPHVRQLCRDYRALLLIRAAERAAAVEAYYPEAAFEAFLETLETVHAAPGGTILVATINDEVVGCGMLTIPAPGVSEMNRFFLSPKARGAGLGRRFCVALMDVARDQGCTKMKLETGRPLVEARALYTSLGFVEVPFDYKVPQALDGILIAYEAPL